MDAQRKEALQWLVNFANMDLETIKLLDGEVLFFVQPYDLLDVDVFNEVSHGL